MTPQKPPERVVGRIQGCRLVACHVAFGSPHAGLGDASKNSVLYRNMATIESFVRLSDDDLLQKAGQLAAAARVSTADLVAALAELDRRRLYLQLGYSSLFVYCTTKLHLTEGEACNRIEAARAARRFPRLLPLLADGTLSLTGVRLLAPHLTADNCDEVLQAAGFQGTRAIEKMVAHLRPEPPVPSLVRKLPQSGAARVAAPTPPTLGTDVLEMPTRVVSASTTSPHSSGQRPVVKPLSDAHYKVQSPSAAKRTTN